MKKVAKRVGERERVQPYPRTGVGGVHSMNAY